MEQTRGKDEQGRIILTDGRLVMAGPWLDHSGFTDDIGDGFRVGVDVIKPDLLDYEKKMPRVKFRDYLRIMNVKIARNYYTVSLPTINFLEEDLWTRDLAEVVAHEIKSLREYAQRQRMVDYVVGKIMARFEKERELNLPDGRILVGDLSCALEWNRDELIGCDIMRIAGKAKQPTSGLLEDVTILTIKHLSHNPWPGAEKQPCFLKNREVWCRKLEWLVVSYLNMLVGFSARFFGEQLGQIAQRLTSQSEWSVECHQLMQKLLTLDPDTREDERVKKVFELVEEVKGLGK